MHLCLEGLHLKTLILQRNEQTSYLTYLASVCFCIIMLHIISCVFMYPAGYTIGSVLSCLHVYKLNQTELECHPLHVPANTDVSITKQLHMYPPPVAPAKTECVMMQ
jgi:hypothetical protein